MWRDRGGKSHTNEHPKQHLPTAFAHSPRLSTEDLLLSAEEVRRRQDVWGFWTILGKDLRSRCSSWLPVGKAGHAVCQGCAHRLQQPLLLRHLLALWTPVSHPIPPDSRCFKWAADGNVLWVSPLGMSPFFEIAQLETRNKTPHTSS